MFTFCFKNFVFILLNNLLIFDFIQIVERGWGWLQRTWPVGFKFPNTTLFSIVGISGDFHRLCNFETYTNS